MKLIGLVGQKQVGKDTLADFIVKKYGYTKMSLAQPLKEACKSIFQLSNEQVNGNLKEVPDARWNNVTPRKLLQTVGTQLFRDELIKHIPELNNMENTIWIHNFNLWYEKNKDKKIVISDIRFIDEANMITNHGGTLIKITKGEFNNNDLHQSEQELSNIQYDILIENHGTIDEYYNKIDNLF